MNETEFRSLLQEQLVPMLSGTRLGKRRASKPSHSLVAYGAPTALLLKPSPDADYRVQLLRSQKFSSEEKQLVTYFMDELTAILPHASTRHFRDLLGSIPRAVISKLLPSANGRPTLEQSIQRLESFASQTYEGRPVVLALGMTGSWRHGPITLEELWAEDFARVLSNGFDSMYVCGSDGRVFKLAYLPSPPSVEFAPHRLGSIAEWCSKAKRVAVVLNRNGEVLVFKDKKLQFAKRRGAWRYYAHTSVVQRLGVGNTALRRAVYESCLDVSFARTGGCLAVLTDAGAASVGKLLVAKDLIINAEQVRTQLLAHCVKKSFQQLDRRFRQELLSMDGATVLKHTGEVITAGAIVRVPGGSPGGGRKAAALQLSKLGLAIKVSADGPISGYRRKIEIFAS